MAFSGSDPILAKRRFFHAAAVSAAVYNLSIAFFSWINQQGGKPDLQVVEVTYGTAGAQVICSGACTLRALILNKPTTTAGYAKFSNHATDYSGAAVMLVVGQNVIDAFAAFYPKGLTLSTGLTYESHTAVDGTTTSAAGDGATGVAVISA
ncbi:MAG TPA: hypothetical protein VM118_11670 [Acidobacteriota bacterium]|nr:hypothetical protein [Acidobacteriota bacterium]